MLDQAADFLRAERFLPAFTLGEPTRLVPTRAFRAKWMPVRAKTTRQIAIIEATRLIRVRSEKI
ncbi:hypothetical protein B2M20_03555 [Nitrobacter vulgaris]|uniref:Uncharacterized protein n=1 Tax=Nitrobacter vulgaris TaxID=29421 RepID=A0A1V4I1D9_NITVU|nr:hypothetical protein B2M20_03555 [Nitrobacter vulgaris]